MAPHEPFNFKTSEELLKKAKELGINLPFQEAIDPLFMPIMIGSKTISNRLAVQPMEGFDGNFDGSPSELTFRRYKRYVEGGSGLIWFEATSVVQEGRSNPRQLMLNQNTLVEFRRLIEYIRALALGNNPFLVLQLTHSGRYSKPEGKLLHKLVCHNPYLDSHRKDHTIFSDEELDQIKDTLVEASGFAYKAGFDAVDIKACHGYPIHDLLGARTRANSRYGGSFENRIRFLVDVVKQVRLEIPEVTIAVRLSATDEIPHPFGFGVKEDGSAVIDLSETKKLIRLLIDRGCRLFNITAGIPKYSAHIGRPYDRPVSGEIIPEEHPLESVCRLVTVTSELQREFPSIPFVGTGYSWLRRFFPNVGAAVLQQKKASFIGLGRSSFAYPDAPKDLMKTGKMSPRKTCITCSKCTELMSNNLITGCVVRDKEIYGKEYKKLGFKE